MRVSKVRENELRPSTRVHHMFLRQSRLFGTASACLLLSSAVRVEARPCGRVPANLAFAESALIVKGSLISTATGDAPGSDSTSVIRIDRILKGNATQGEIVVTHFLCGIEYRFAMRQGRSVLAFVNASGGLVGGTAVLPASSAGTTSVSTDPTTNVRNELLLAARDEDANTARAAVGALAELDGRKAMPTLLLAANRAEFGMRVRALAWLTRFGDANAFDQLAAVVSAPPFTPLTIPTTIRDDQGASLAIADDDVVEMLWSFRESDLDVPTVPSTEPSRFVRTMTRVARSQDLAVRQAAIHALRVFKHPASFPVLAEALDDPDRDVRYDAVVTLCMAMKAPDLPCPSVPLFEKDEQKYIRPVRAWWKSRP
jgi:hypothetical protein